MAIIPKNDYTGRINSTDPEYPQGKAINIIGTTAGTGTPVEEKWLNDDWGFKQEILSEAGITPSGVPDKVGSSQYLDGIKTITSDETINELSQAYEPWKSVAEMQADTTALPVGKKVFWQGYYAESDGGSNWGIVKSGAHTDDGGSVFTLNDGKYVDANLKGAAINIRKFGAKGGDSAIDTATITAALSHTMAIGLASLYVPVGNFLISATLREATNGGGLKIRGEHRKRSILTSTGFDGALIHVGNSNGHGNYRADIRRITLDCAVVRAAGSIGLITHENGTSVCGDIDIRNFDQNWLCPGCISMTIDGKCEIGTGNNGILFSTPATGTPSGPDDITTTASPLSLNPNVSEVKSVWFTGMQETTLQLTGGMMRVVSCTFQSCGNSLSHDVISIVSGNEAFAFAGGPLVEANWIEGGTYRYAIAVRATNQARILNNFIGGSSTNSIANKPKEGGIFIDSACQNTRVKGNSVFQFFVATPTEGRLANAAIYTEQDLYRDDVFDNFISKSQVLPYYEGLTDPTKTRGHNDIEIIVDCATAAVVYDSHGVATTISDNGTGDFTISWGFNREIVAGANYQIDLDTRTNSATKSYSVSAFGSGNPSNERVIVHNQLGALEDPRSIILRMKSGYQGV